MNFIKEMLQKDITKKIIAVLIIGILLYAMRKLINLFLLTFLLTYLVYSLQDFVLKKLHGFMRIKPVIVTVIIYALIITSVTLLAIRYVPVLIVQISSIIYEISQFMITPEKYRIGQYIMPVFDQIRAGEYLKEGGQYLADAANYVVRFASNIGSWSFNIVGAVVLSLFFMLEREKVKNLMEKFKTSRIAWIYKYFEYVGSNFLNSFGKVIRAQIMISLINSILSFIALSIMGFPKLLGLGVMIFVFGLVPVAGVIMSFIPLAIIAYNVGGFVKVIYIIIMVLALHGLENYFLNPKLMSVHTKLPVFFIFLILIVSEVFMGVWGLLLGIPLFMFFMDLVGVDLKENNA